MKKIDIACVIYIIALLSFGFKNGDDLYGSKTSGVDRKLDRTQTRTSLIAQPHIISGSPYYTDNFDGTNDTTALKTRGYKVYYRGTGAQAGPTWFQGNISVFTSFNGPTNGYVAANFQVVSGVNAIDSWLVLPALNVATGDSLYFYERSPTGNPFPDSIAVLYSAAGDSTPEAGTWVTLAYFRTTETGSWARRGFRAPTGGTTARWAIRYLIYDGGPSGMNSNYLGVDALTVEAPAGTNDIGTVANVAPTGSIQANSATIAPKATFQNFGTAAQTSISVSYAISPGGYSSTKTIASLVSGASTTVTFDSTFVPAPAGTYNYTIISNLATDGNRANDTLRGSFTVVEQNWGGGGGGTGGYFFANSVSVGAPSRPTFGWVDPIANGHTAITTWTSGDADDGFFRVPALPFSAGSFSFFGVPIPTDSAFIGSNGYITFRGGTTTTAGGASIPSASTPNNWIAGCAMDIDTRPGTSPAAQIYYGGNSSQFVVTYRNARYFGSATDSITFQIILFANGNIKVQYNETGSSLPLPGSIGNDALIGIENAAGTLGVQYRNNGTGGPIFGSSLALEFGLNQNTLPVQLASFTATLQQNAVRLDWTTLSEVNNYGFYVERKRAGELNFSDLPNNFINGHGTTLEPHSYSFIDNTVTSGVYHYRLRQVDLDGTQHFTEPITINVSSPTSVSETAPKVFALFQNYPNPFNPETQVKFSVDATAQTTLELYNTLGQQVAILFNEVAEAGRYYSIRVNASSLASGIYFYKLQSGTKTDLKKMVLLK